MSAQRTLFEQAAKTQSWDVAADQLNGLAMFEMLPALAGLGAGRAEAATKICAVLNGRGWTGSAERIKWAGEVVANRRLPSWRPDGFPPDQVENAQHFLSASGPSLSTVSGSAHADVMAAVRRGQISGGGAAQLLEFEKNGVLKGAGGGTASISPLVFTLLQGLTPDRTTIEVMNIARPDDNPHSPHGRGAAGEQRTSFACDISAYDGVRILLRNDGSNVEPTIRAVAGILRRLPPGFYKFGFPRPSTQLGGPVFPDFDVFLPAKSMVAVSSPPPGKFGKSAVPLIVNPDALSAVQSALDGNPKARFSMMFPDAYNHVHIEIISSP